MKKHFKALQNKYLPALILGLLFFSQVQAQYWQPLPNYFKLAGAIITNRFGLPIQDTTFTPPSIGFLTVRPQDSLIYTYSGYPVGPKWIVLGSGASSASWGNIHGTITSQTDLMAQLNGKQPLLSAGTSSQYRKGDNTLGTLSTDVTAVTNPLYAPISHTHSPNDITGLTAFIRGAISVTGTGGSYNSSTGVINLTGGSGTGATYTFGAPLSVDASNNVTLTKTLDHTYISDFASYARGLHSASLPLGYNSTTGNFTVDTANSSYGLATIPYVNNLANNTANIFTQWPLYAVNSTTLGIKMGTDAQSGYIDSITHQKITANTNFTGQFNLVSPVNGSVIKYNSTDNKWEVGTDNTGGTGGSSTLAGLSDVAVSSPVNNNGLVYNGSKWANQPLTAITLTNPKKGNVITYDSVSNGLVNSGGQYIDTTGRANGKILTWLNDTIRLSTPQSYSQVNADWNAVSGVAQILNKPTLATVATTGSYLDLSNKPTIPAAQVNSDWNASSGVAQILNKPTIPAAQVNSDWNAVSGVAQILNKPALATVATSGSYTDLINKPSIPSSSITLSGPVTGSGTTGSTITTSIANTTVTPGTYTNANITVGADGRITGASSGSSGSGGGGTVTSVGLSMPSGFTVANSPITGSGTFNVTTALSGILKASGGSFSTVAIGSGLSYDGTTLSATGAGYAAGNATTNGLFWNGSTYAPRNIAASDIPVLNQSTTGTAANVTGVVALANGGTGQTSRQAAINALAGTQAAGYYLRSDGTNTSLSPIQASDIPTLNQNTTGTSSNVTGTVAIANGGTGAATQQAAINALAGTQSAGKVLRSDGTNTTLSSIQSGDLPSTISSNTTGSAASLSANLPVSKLNSGSGASSGTFFRGDGTWSRTLSLGNATTQNDFLDLSPTDYGTGKPQMFFQKSATATAWTIGLWDGTNSNGSINFQVQNLTWSGNRVLTTADAVGEANTGQNLGTGVGVYSAKSGVALQFNSISGGIGTTAALSGNNIVVQNSAYDAYNQWTTTTSTSSTTSSLNVPIVTNSADGVEVIVDGFGADGNTFHGRYFLSLKNYLGTTTLESTDNAFSPRGGLVGSANVYFGISGGNLFIQVSNGVYTQTIGWKVIYKLNKAVNQS